MKKITAILLSLFVIFGLFGCGRAEAPRVEKGEFPFEVVYELDGRVITVSDVYVCEFDGFTWNENAGRIRQWRGYIKSSEQKELVLLEDGGVQVICTVGSPEYYMSDPSVSYTEAYTPSVSYVERLAGGGVFSGTLDSEQLLERYGIRIISWSFAEPIENVYE